MKVLKSPDELLQEFAKDNYTIKIKDSKRIIFEHPEGYSSEHPDFTPKMFDYCGKEIKDGCYTFKNNWLKEITVKTKTVVKSPDEILKILEEEGYKPRYVEGDIHFYPPCKPDGDNPIFNHAMFALCGSTPEGYAWKKGWLKEIER